MTLRRSILGLVGLSALLGACQIQPGEYRVYRIANEDSEQSNGCFPSTPGPDVTGDSTTVRVGQTFGIFAADPDTYFLDFEALSLAGVRDGKDYAFNGETVDVMVFGPNNDSTQTVTSILDVDLTISGRQLEGTSVLEVTSECVGMSCPTPANTVCTTTTSFQGSEVKDVELEHSI
ncbi:MAG: hypothetical protein KDK70_28785 [Myxococcales bacterium]|nr:hypothetical protein [Myxococcales bacterium]